MTDCDACLRGDHESCAGVGCACFERTCAAAQERELGELELAAEYVTSRRRKGKPVYAPNRFDRLVLRFFGWKP